MNLGFAEMQSAIKGLPSADREPTAPEKIRALHAAGCAPADIARFLGLGDSYVRSALKRGPLKSKSGAARPRTEGGELGEVESQKLRVGDDGRFVIPAEMRAAMAIDESGQLTARVVDGELRVLSPLAAILKMRRMVRKRADEGVSPVDELIAERRAEARREDGE